MGTLRRTIHAAKYLSDPAYRRRIGRQLNKGESLHALRRDPHYAQQDTIAVPHLADQTEQAWCLTVLTNAVITWTTEYYLLAAKDLRAGGRDVPDEILAHILQQWVTKACPGFTRTVSPALWPSERSPRIGFSQMNTRFAAYRDALGLDVGLDFHSFRRSYVTHLIEDGWDPRFVQEQVGHEHASTTSIYTCVSVSESTAPAVLSLPQTGIGNGRPHDHRCHLLDPGSAPRLDFPGPTLQQQSFPPPVLPPARTSAARQAVSRSSSARVSELPCG
jgi:hypothetical protein